MAFGGIVGKSTTTYTNEEIQDLINTKVEIISGSYVGKGTYGSDSPNTIILSNLPWAVVVWSINAGRYDGYIWFFINKTNITNTRTTNSVGNVQGVLGQDIYYTFSTDNKSLIWYNNSNPFNQFNQNNYTYYYLAFV